MTFLSGQDDFFQTANQPISVRHLSQPYNNREYCTVVRKFEIYFECRTRYVISEHRKICCSARDIHFIFLRSHVLFNLFYQHILY